MPVGCDDPATYRVRRNPNHDSRAFVAAWEDFSSERHPVGRPAIRVHQPPGGVSTVKFGEHRPTKETEYLLKRRRDSDLKRREMYGPSVIFVRADSGKSEGNGADRTGVRIPQPAGKVSQSSVGGEESALLNRMVTSSISEAAQQDLSGTMELEDDSNAKRVSFLSTKAKELAENSNSEPPLPGPSRQRNVERQPANIRSGYVYKSNSFRNMYGNIPYI